MWIILSQYEIDISYYDSAKQLDYKLIKINIFSVYVLSNKI